MLGSVYQIGQSIHRRVTEAHRLERPVISVGNVAVGGRAKTPFVVGICNWLLEHKYYPVVLSRGYAREKKDEVWIEPDSNHIESLTYKDTGDEALEIYYSAQGTTVLVGKKRVQNAVNYQLLQTDPRIKNRIVFVLDDGFQHWSLERDFNLLLLDPKDFTDWTLPWGKLRESVKSGSQRADIIFVRGTDFDKVTEVVAGPEDHGENALVLTTRAKENSYIEWMKEQFPVAEFIQLKDHASLEKIQKAILNKNRTQLLVGAKEAVKILEPKQIENFFKTGHATVENLIPGKVFDLFFVKCNLDLKEEDRFWSRLQVALNEWD